jgi:uncharacterized membrane protein
MVSPVRTMDLPSTSPATRRLNLYRLDAHHRFFAALGVAALAVAFTPWQWHWTARVLAAWNAYSFCTLVLCWITLANAEPCDVAKTASLQDSSRKAIFVFVLIAACASVFAVAAELSTAKGLDPAHFGGHIIFALLTVLSSWLLVHTVFALRYAHIYYEYDERDKPAGGLNFPDENEPDYLDFAYFSFVIGMTSQVSDVTISARRVRRLALLHGLISFGFNLSILGLCINMISGLF